jgi:hypothetical protein
MDLDVREDPDLEPIEKETTVRFSKNEDVLHIYSEEGSIVNRLLHHDEFDESHRRTVDDAVVAVGGSLPISCLTIKAGTRSTENHSVVVSQGVFNE